LCLLCPAEKEKQNWHSLFSIHQACYSRWLDIGLILFVCFVYKFVLDMIMDWNCMLAHKNTHNKTTWQILNHLINNPKTTPVPHNYNVVPVRANYDFFISGLVL